MLKLQLGMKIDKHLKWLGFCGIQPFIYIYKWIKCTIKDQHMDIDLLQVWHAKTTLQATELLPNG